MADEDTLIKQGSTDIIDTTLPPHTLLLHTYEVERLLAYGGMGEVYLARHTELGTRHAIKIIKPELTGAQNSLDVLELFRREAATLRGIRHEAVVSYDGFFRDEKKNYYLVMEYVDGPSLSQVLKQRVLSVDEVYRLRDRLAVGLAAAHDQGVTHRDLSPDNVILPEGQIDKAKLIDFGIAKLADATAATIIGPAFAGKLRYVAPEQLGLFGAKISPASDIYSLGLVLAAVVGKPLAMGDSFGSAVEARQKAPDLSQIPAGLQPQLRTMLQPNPANRPQSASELLRRWPRPQPVKPGSRPPRQEAAKAWLKPYWMLLLLAVGGVALAVGWLVYQGMEPPSQRRTDSRPESPRLTDDAQESRSEQLAAPPVAMPAPEQTPVREQPPAPGPAPLPDGAGSVSDAISKGRPEQSMAPPAPEQTPAMEPEPAVSPPPAERAEPIDRDTARPEQPAPPPVAQPAPAPEPARESEKPSPVLVPPARVEPVDSKAKQQPPSATPVTKPAPANRAAPSKPPVSSKPKPVEKETSKYAKPVPESASQPHRSGGSKPARCGDVLLKAQLGEPLSASDRAFLQKECR